jgi:hypothetical protein
MQIDTYIESVKVGQSAIAKWIPNNACRESILSSGALNRPAVRPEPVLSLIEGPSRRVSKPNNVLGISRKLAGSEILYSVV